ncbi:MAG TPA: hypothetical protein VFI70_08580 [Nitrososphaeraceae archaeon]|nr:hypothetical protein [Nitrososphaeraceae archaeon]
MNSTFVKIGNKPYPMNYFVANGRLNSISVEPNNITLSANVSSTSNGTLTIELPRTIIDSKNPGSNMDHKYQLFQDGKNLTAFKEIKNTDQSRTLQIQFTKSTQKNNTIQIEIAGTQSQRSATTLSQVYSPRVYLEALKSNCPSPVSTVEVIANVKDIFGKNDRASLYYSIGCISILCKDTAWHSVNMTLIWGTPSNGRFAGTIPPILRGNTTVSYYINVDDDLHYSNSTHTREFITSSDDTAPPSISGGPFYFPISNKSAIIEAWVTDIGTGVKNVNFTNGTTYKQLNLIEGNKWDGLYRVSVSPEIGFPKNAIGYVIASDYAKHNTNTIQTKPAKINWPLNTVPPWLLNTIPDIYGKFNMAVSPEPSVNSSMI